MQRKRWSRRRITIALATGVTELERYLPGISLDLFCILKGRSGGLKGTCAAVLLYISKARSLSVR